MDAPPSAIASGVVRGRGLALGALAAGVLLAGALLTVVFWWPLWKGGGLVGSDIYAYFLPQKAFYAERLRDGALPLWNNRVGWGYPQLAESQTGVFYPLHLPLYFALDLNTAFNASIVLHYVLAFAFAWMYARELRLSPLAAGFAALVFTYGWFPPRVCVEWAIVGGAWLPLALWCAERYLRSGYWRYAILMTVALGLQMLAGHFTLAFVTQLSIALYVPLRLWWNRPEAAVRAEGSRRGTLVAVAASIAGAFLLAAVQLVPTWELKQQSQRQNVTAEHDPAYGSIPPAYLTQVVAPWYWYPDEQAFAETWVVGGARTNRVEAHLYFGLIPLALAAYALWQSRKNIDRALAIWLLLGFASVVYSTGVLIPVTRHLPGFSYFEGAGRYGIVATLSMALWAGTGFSLVLRRSPPLSRWPIAIVVFALSIGDLWLVSREVTFAVMVPNPPLSRLAESPVRAQLAKWPEPVRLFSPGKNLPSLLGVSTLPVYLGLGPAAYFDPERMFPGELDFASPPKDGQVEWLRRAGVTHLLSFVAIDAKAWPVRPAWEGVDPFLNAALARLPNEPMFLYALDGTRGRVSGSGPEKGLRASISDYQPERVALSTVAERSDRIILTDLYFPGWTVTVDDRPTEGEVVEGVFRGVQVSAGPHVIVWNYRPQAVYWGGGISLVTAIGLLALGHVRFWHPHWWAR